MASQLPKGVNEEFRRTWNKDDYKPKDKVKLTKTKNEFSKSDVIKKEKLKAREFLLDLDRRVGKTVALKKTPTTLTDGGYYCDVCQCAINDSTTFLDHINGIKHQKNLGMSMKIERSSHDQVKARIQKVTEMKEEQMNKKVENFEEKIERLKQVENEKKRLKKERKKRKKIRDEASEEEVDSEVLRVMGFTGFSSKH